MKKLSIIMLALALGLVMSVPAMAIHIGSPDPYEGSLGITGRYQFDGEAVDIDGNKADYFDDDLDLSIVTTLGDVKFFVGLELSDRVFEGGSGGRDGDAIAYVDNYYVEWAAMENLKLKIGEYSCSFGRAIATDGACASNIQLSYSMDMLDISGILAKNQEGWPTTDDDDDEIILLADLKGVGPFTTLSAASYMQQNDLSATENSYMGLDVALDIGPVALAMEYGGNGGDLDGSFYVFEVGLEGLIGFDVNLNYFQSSDDYTQVYEDNDWSPVIIYGDNINGNLYDTSAMWVDVSYGVNDKLTVSAQALFMAENDAGDEYGTEFDVGLKYKVADNVSYAAAYGSYSEGDGVLAGDTDYTELWHRLQFTF